MSGRILVVDDEARLRELLRIVLEGEGYTVREAGTYRDAVAALGSEPFDLVICDIVLPDGNGLDLLRSHHPLLPETHFVMITAHSSPAHMLTSVREGAVEYVSKPFDVEELKLIIAKQLAHRRGRPAIVEELEISGESPAMWPILERIPQVARSDATVLVTGESGTGKELLARAIHAASPRGRHPFVPVNCGALPEGLLESELFGHVRGAFTGAVRDSKGLFQEAAGGTIFLDEIGELPLALQVKLLRALQDKRIRPVGGSREVAIDTRVIAATNADLTALIEQGRFREDLYFRINVIHLEVPPLRERREDIPVLTRLFVDRACQRFALPRKEIHRDAMTVLCSYPWPGNVRELENVIEQAVAMESSSLITVSSLPERLFGGLETPPPRRPELELPPGGLDLEAHTDAIRRELMRQALERCGGVQKEAARLLRMSYRAFRYHAEKYRLVNPEETS